METSPSVVVLAGCICYGAMKMAMQGDILPASAFDSATLKELLADGTLGNHEAKPEAPSAPAHPPIVKPWTEDPKSLTSMTLEDLNTFASYIAEMHKIAPPDLFDTHAQAVKFLSQNFGK